MIRGLWHRHGMTTFLLVPGANHGGWWYQPLVERLADAGHRGVAITLPGLDPDTEASTQLITLDDHVAHAVAEFEKITSSNGGREVVLVGHSYGGSIVSAVADAKPSHVRALVYLDALLPEDGDSSWSMTNNDEHEWYVTEVPPGP